MLKYVIPFLAVGLVGAAVQQPASAAPPLSIQLASSHLTKEQVVDRVFTNIERRILQRYYETRHGSSGAGGKNKGAGKGKNKGLPPGLAKRGGDLPPGLAKRGGTLPPGLAKKLPGDLRQELPPRGRGYRRVIVDNDIVLIDAVTNKILDVIEDVIRGS